MACSGIIWPLFGFGENTIYMLSWAHFHNHLYMIPKEEKSLEETVTNINENVSTNVCSLL